MRVIAVRRGRSWLVDPGGDDILNPGDVLFLHHLLLFRNGRNQSGKARWSMMPRYGKMLDADMVARGWAIERSSDYSALKTIRPDAIAGED